MPANDKHCWGCHRDRARLPCPKCFRNYHYQCVTKAINFPSDQIIVDPNDLRNHKLKLCPECYKMDQAASDWMKEVYFQKMPQTVLNKLLLYILDYLKKTAPDPYLWPATKMTNSECPVSIDLTMIKNKATAALYNSPSEFLADIFLINHNYAVIARNPGTRDREKAAMAKLLNEYKEKMVDFKNTAEARIRYLEDCPHCILNFHNHGDAWLTMTCPWGHPLILCRIPDEESLWPAKFIKHNHKSSRVDVILFGDGARSRVNRKDCWIPCRSDLDVQHKNADLKVAYDQAIKYASTLKKKFGMKYSMSPLRRKLAETDKAYVFKDTSSKEEDDVIVLTDDEQSPPSCGTIIDRCLTDEDTNDGADRRNKNERKRHNSKAQTSKVDANNNQDADRKYDSNINNNINHRNNDRGASVCNKGSSNTKSVKESSKIPVNQSKHNNAREKVKEPLKESSKQPVRESLTDKDCGSQNGMGVIDKVNEKTADNDSSIFKKPESETEQSTECAMEEPIVSSTQTTLEETDILTNDQFTQFEISESEPDGISFIAKEDDMKMEMDSGESSLIKIAEDFVIEERGNFYDEPKSSPVLNHFTLSLDEKDETTIFESTSIMTEVSESYFYESAQESLDQTIKTRKFFDDSFGHVSKKMKHNGFDYDIVMEFPKIMHRLEVAENELLQLRKEEDYRENVESVKVKTLEDDCDKLKKELQEANKELQKYRADFLKNAKNLVELKESMCKFNQEREELIVKTNTLNETVQKLTSTRDELVKKIEIIPELQKTVDKLSKEREEFQKSFTESQGMVLKLQEERVDLLKKTSSFGELQQIVENLKKEREELLKKMDNLSEQHRLALIKQTEELNSSNEKKLNDLKSHQEKLITEMNDTWEKKSQKMKEAQDSRFNRLQNKCKRLRSSIEASLNLMQDVENDTNSEVPQNQDNIPEKAVM